jgi:hypothetical protein
MAYMNKRILPLAICLAAVPAAGAQAKTLHVFETTTSLTLVHLDGTREANPTGVPASAGDMLDIYTLAYRGTRKHHTAQPVGSSHTVCTFAKAGPPACTDNVELGDGLLSLVGNKIIGGTRAYAGARGRVKTRNVNDKDHSANVTVRLHFR